MKIVYVITNVESGWDCVRGVFYQKQDAINFCAELDNVKPGDWDESDSMYIINETWIK